MEYVVCFLYLYMKEFYMQTIIDAKGKAIPRSMVKPIDRIRDDLVVGLGYQAQNLSTQLQRFKENAMMDIQNFLETSAGRYKLSFGGQKGNLTLYSFDKKFKLIMAVSERIAFNEQLLIAKKLIDECIKEWVEGVRLEVRVLIDRAFQVDKQGQINVKRILELQHIDIKDKRWKKAMQAINNSITIVASKSYVRMYYRQEDGKYSIINLNIAK